MHDLILPPPASITSTDGADYRPYKSKGQVYTTTGVFAPDAPQRTGENLDAVGVMILDFDHPKKDQLRDLDDQALAVKLAAYWLEVSPTLPAPPSRVACSGYGFHVYYWLDENHDPSVVRRANRRLVSLVPLADQSVHDAGTRLLRPLGTYNTKNPDRPRLVELVESNDVRYSLEALAPVPDTVAAIAGASTGYKAATVDFDKWLEPVRLDKGGAAVISDIVANLKEGEKLRLACPEHKGRSASSAFIRLLDGVPALTCTGCGVTWRHAGGVAADLDRDKHGRPRATVANVALLLEPLDLCYLDLMDGRTWIGHNFNGRLHGTTPRPVSDIDVTILIKYLRESFDLAARPPIVFEAIAEVAAVAARHPLRDSLNELASKWDGTSRLDHWLSDCCPSVEDTELIRAYSRRFVLGMIARAFNSGCKFDNVLVLVGAQGAKKSTLVQLLGGGGRYVGEGHLDFRDNKHAVEKISGRWVYELAEIDKYGSQDAARVKDFVTVTHDRERPAYGRAVVDTPRITCFVGTSNRRDLLMDETGSRRFWIVDIGDEIDTDYFATYRDLLIGEAVQYWHENRGADYLLYLPPELERAREVQNVDDFTTRHHLCSPIIEAFKRGAHGFDSMAFTSGEISTAIGLLPNDIHGRRYGVPAALRELGAVRSSNKIVHNGTRARVWSLDLNAAPVKLVKY